MLSLSYVYVVGNGRAVKIGKSCRPETRIGELDTASHTPLVTYYVGATNGDGGAIERQAHALLAGRRLKGEWFDATAALAIAAVEQAAVDVGLQIMRCDDGSTSAGAAPPPLKGYRRIWASDLPLIHKLNLSALRAITGIVLLGLVAATGVIVAFAIQFIIIANR